MQISASFLGITEKLAENIKILDNTSIDYIHIDIMDGLFVSNKTADLDSIYKLISPCKKPLDIHLMVYNVYKYIDALKPLSPHYITIHYEANIDILKALKYIKSSGIKAGLSINPTTNVNVLLPYLKYLDLILIMSVEPGLSGQAFIPSIINKVSFLNQIRMSTNYNYKIEVDGGINNHSIKLLSLSDICVVGSYITDSKDYQAQVETLKANNI